MESIELLAPAGNLTKLKTALFFGADAVYVGGKNFSLRSYADNFNFEELKEAVEYTHALNKKIYVTVNIFAKNADLSEAEEYFKYLEKIKIDAAIITDAGLIALAKEKAPDLTIHLSTQANTLNKYTVKFWYDMGVKRVVLARELSLKEIKEIKDFVPEMELEAFVHGAMCISYSGRCLLSNYLAGRDSNRGECVQSCRWNWEIREKLKGGEYLTLEEDERGSYILNSKDLNMSENIKDLKESGIMSFKIEGRMKSEYYLATVINAYKCALVELEKQGENFVIPEYIEKELAKTAHREFTKAYYLGSNKNTVNYKDSQAAGTAEFIAFVKDYDNNLKLSKVEMRNRFKIGDELEILSPDEFFNKKFIVEKIINSRGENIEDAKFVQEILFINCPYPIKHGSILRKLKK
jgi:putative protease